MPSVYEIVTNNILTDLQAGTVPWRKSWANGGTPMNWKSKKEYRGVNQFILPPGEYASYKQVTEAGGKVPAGTKGKMAVFFKPTPKTPATANSPERKSGLILRYYTVFNIVECGLTPRRKTKEHNTITEAENMVRGYLAGGPLTGTSDRACYVPSLDVVNMPALGQFESPEAYYSTYFHELVHSTGHSTRLNRFTPEESHVQFGDESYSKEELIAECGAAMLCAIVGIETQAERTQNAAYIAHWIGRLKNDTRLIVQAAGKAQHAADMIRGKVEEMQEEEGLEEAA